MEFTIGSGDDEKPAADAPKRRGRPPASANGAAKTPARAGGSAKSKAAIDGALATMDSAYSALSMGLLMLRRPLSAELVALRSEQWQASNRQAFESSPRLAAAISGVGQASGVMMFAVTNIVAAGSIMLAVREESAAIAAQTQPPAEGDSFNG